MQHMGCEPDRASYNIMVDAYGRAGLHEGKYLILKKLVTHLLFTQINFQKSSLWVISMTSVLNTYLDQSVII